MRKLMTLLTVIACLAFSQISLAQTKTGKIRGLVQDAASKAIPSATISIHRAKDSVLIKMAVADATGKFELDNLAEGRYLISTNAIGFGKTWSAPLEINGAAQVLDLPVIRLNTQPKALAGVSVTSKRPLIEQKLDRTIVNVDASPTNVGSTALEVLEKSPGITVDKDGNISLKGKAGVVVYIDGRPSYLSGTELANLLRNMQASQLDQIEIMTNPPAKYDAAGNSGIINIRTKKIKTAGFNGSVSVGYGQGVYPKTNESINLNFRKKKFNLFANYSFNKRRGWQDLNIYRRFVEKDSKELVSIFDQDADISMRNRSHDAKLGLDFFASKKTTLGFVLTGFASKEDFRNANRTNIMDKTGVSTNTTIANTRMVSHWKSWSANLNFRHLIDSTGRELTADIDFARYNSDRNQSMENHFYNAAGQMAFPSDTLNGSLPGDIRIYSAKLDYSQPIGKTAKLEAGLKTSFVRNDNTARYDSIINNNKVPDWNRTNQFIYDENISAAYLNMNKQFNKKWSAQAGLRFEHTRANGNQLGNPVRQASAFTRNYSQLFPTLYIGYQASEKNQYAISLGRRIERPDYEDMNPFIHFLDRYTFESGNPNLQPQFSNNIELSHSYKGKIITTLNYSRVNNIFESVLEQNEQTNETFIRKSNIAKQRNMGISVSANLPLAKWWNLNVYSNLFNNRYTGNINGVDIDASGTMFMTNITSQFSLNKGWNAELSGFYRTRGVEGIIIIRPIGMVNMGVSRQVMKKKGTVRLNIRDAFFTQKFRGESKYGNVDVAFRQTRESRVLNLGFSYRFGKSNGGQRRRNTGGAGDEQNRVRTGGNGGS